MNTFAHSMTKPVYFFLMLLFPTVTVAIQAGIESPALGALKSKFAENVHFRAEMSHHFTDSYTKEVTSTYGTIWFGKDRYKIDTPDQIIVVNGDLSTVYNKAQNRVIISTYNADEDEFAPSRFFAGQRDTYRSEDFRGQDGTTSIMITSDDPFELFTEVKITISRDGLPLEIEAIDQMENNIKTAFRFGRFERSSNAVFTIQYPDNAEIIDLRQ